MVYKSQFKIVDNLIAACDYEFVLNEVDKAIRNRKRLLISPIASHTLIHAHYDKNLKQTLDNFDYLVPDSQWLRWSIHFLYGKDKSLDDRVYGPELMLKICNLSERKSYKLFLYGTNLNTLNSLKINLTKKFTELKVVGFEPSKFRELTKDEWRELIDKIIKSKAEIIFIGLGSPLQEIFTYKLDCLLHKKKNSKIIIPVGAAFDFISGIKKQAPTWVQNFGLEWFYRLLYEPGRLWKRYLLYGPFFIFLILKDKFRLVFD